MSTDILLFILSLVVVVVVVVKGKSIPLQAWTGLEGCRSLRLPDFKTVDT